MTSAMRPFLDALRDGGYRVTIDPPSCRADHRHAVVASRAEAPDIRAVHPSLVCALAQAVAQIPGRRPVLPGGGS